MRRATFTGLCAIFTLVLSLAAGPSAWALDTIKTPKGVLSGHVVGMDATKVEYQPASGGDATKEVPVNQILIINFDNEPKELRSAKDFALKGRYEEGLSAIHRLKSEPSREEIQKDVEYYRAYFTAKLALGGSQKIAAAGLMMKAFADANEKNYHYYDAVELVGDLFLAVHQYPQATEYYARLDNAPWPEYKMRAGAATGRTLLDQGKAAEALTAFDKVIAADIPSDSPVIEAATAQRTAATLGKASALVALKRCDEGIKLIEEVIQKTDAEDAPAMARAYNVLGRAYRQSGPGHEKEALLAFLHVDRLYASVPDSHAEALANLVELWEQVHKNERANRDRKTLQEKYPDSPWTKKLGE
jgi:hypothetical protein